jgi:glycosidase
MLAAGTKQETAEGTLVLRSHAATWLPGWAARAIFYHIYPLGFLGAPRANPGGEQVHRLADLRRWYGHIRGLGVNAIYFGPLFESLTHGYDTTDYFSVDRRLGSNALFQEIVDELHSQHIHVILDGVFNHTGREFFAFKDIRHNKRSSPYTDWYHINWGADSEYGDGFAYDSWAGYQSLPRLNLDNPDTRKYIFEVARMWLNDYGVDGWRLDVAQDIAPSFWWEFRRVCKEINPDCFLLGELDVGDYRAWVAPDLLDSGTNYQLYHTVHRAFNDQNLSALGAIMERASNPEFGLYKDILLFNFLGNHDVSRILSQLDEPRDYLPALIFLMTVPGIPCIYYGEEVGLLGRKNEDDSAMRQPMPANDADWPDTGHGIYSHIARLAALRRAHPALIYGSFESLEAGPTHFAFLRQHIRERAVVAINSGEQPIALKVQVGPAGVPDGVTFHDLLDPSTPALTVKRGQLEVPDVAPGWGRILASEA